MMITHDPPAAQAGENAAAGAQQELEELYRRTLATLHLRGARGTDEVHRLDADWHAWLRRQRAREVADEVHLEGNTLTSVAERLNLSRAAVSTWVKLYGPTHFVTVRKTRATRFEINLVDPGRLGVSRRLRELIAHGGHRVAPAAWGLFDDTTQAVVPAVDAKALWDQLADQEADQ